ncbi:MAG: cytochrome C biogenesis protein [Clostridia bacterium]|nr:cytochrome C biogenesis protein [Clostridia bacterium]
MQVDIKRVKIVVAVPTEYVQVLVQALCEEGAGKVGNYSYCTTWVKSAGTFKPNENANPFIGENDKLVYVEGAQFEVICDIENVGQVIKKLREVHPYEEPGMDIIPLLDESMFL